MKTLHYFLQPVSDAERVAFRDNVTFTYGAPRRWFAFDEDGVYVECETRVVVLPWNTAKEILSMGTLHELKTSDSSTFVKLNEHLSWL